MSAHTQSRLHNLFKLKLLFFLLSFNNLFSAPLIFVFHLMLLKFITFNYFPNLPKLWGRGRGLVRGQKSNFFGGGLIRGQMEQRGKLWWGQRENCCGRVNRAKGKTLVESKRQRLMGGGGKVQRANLRGRRGKR